MTTTRKRTWRTAVAVAAGAMLGASSARADVDWNGVGKEAAAMLAQYIRIDTTNPPGNEKIAAEFLAARLRSEGLDVRVFESQPGRASVLARLPGSGVERPIVLLNHLDVVAANAADWSHPPFAGDIDDGYVYGRGALDCKGMAVVEAMAMVALKRSGARLSRDIIFLATADEEVGGQLGAGWFVEKHFDTLGKPEFVLNEGGEIREQPDGQRVYEVAVAEKTPFWLRMTARGEPGHGSTPRGESAVTRLVAALERIRRYEPRLRVTPEVLSYFRALAEASPDGPMRQRYADLAATLSDPEARQAFLAEPHDAALVRNTISMTVLRAGEKTNVIPAQATADLDCRLLPGEDPAQFLAELKTVVADEQIEFEVMLNFPPSSSGTDTALFAAIQQVAAQEQLPVVPSVLRGFTDSHYFREKGVTSYGFVPVVLNDEDERTMHGTNERISLENLREGPRRLAAILEAVSDTAH